PKGTSAKVTSVAARLLDEHGISPNEVPTRSRRVTKQDVLAYVGQRAAPKPLSSMRRAIAEHMLRSRQTIPDGTTVLAAGLSRLVAWRAGHRDSPTFTTFFAYALARHLEPSAGIGVAVALDNGLIVPVLRQAQTLSLDATARAIADLAERARA